MPSADSRAGVARPAEFYRPREALLQSSLPKKVEVAAAGLRAKARQDPRFLDQLIRDLHHREMPRNYREIVALVLGTIPDSPAQEALASELNGSTDSEWSALLLHALGADKASEADDIFDLPSDAPFVYELAGLHLRIKTGVSNDAARSAAVRFLEDADLDTRRAAQESLVRPR